MPESKYEGPRKAIPAEIARAVKVEAGHQCAIRGCGEHTYLEIHHINENREDNSLGNLILLCDKHHKMSHANVIDRKSLKEYKKLISLPDIDDLNRRFERLELLISSSNAATPEKPSTKNAINLIIEEAVLLGNRLRGTYEGNQVAQQLYSLIRAHGTEFDLTSIDLMVRRGESYSRVGLSGLSILYDEFYVHTQKLGLVNYFKLKDVPELAYYCALRENYLDLSDWVACSKAPSFSFGGYIAMFDDYYLISKYPNRGPSSILDRLVPETPKNEA